MERQILLIECKRPGADTTEGWDDAKVQLGHYCEQSAGGGQKIYGAIGIGTKVTFYQLDNSSLPNPLQELHVGIFDLDDVAGQNAVEYWLNYVKATGWDFVG